MINNLLPRFRLRPLCLAVAYNLWPCAPAFANPVGPDVVNGQVSINNQGSTLTVTNSPNAIINWQQFSIQTGETTQFNQQSAASSVLNRVTGSDPSQLLGTLSSNGKVFLINPSGVLVGQGAQINVAGFVASNLNLSDENFLAGKMKFDAQPTTSGSVENRGEIRTPEGGSVYLVGSEVVNKGLIDSPQGEVILAAGQTVELHDTSTPGVSVEVTGSSNQASNLGTIMVQSGQAGIVGAAVRNSGVINADQIVKDETGRIFLKATGSVTVESGSRISADADPALGDSPGGSISVESAQGDIDIQPDTAITANGPSGGSIAVSAPQGAATLSGTLEAVGSKSRGGSLSADAQALTVTASARLDASGKTQGGQIALTATKSALTVESGAQLSAGGEQGGSITLNAQQAGIVQDGTIDVRGWLLNGGQADLQAAATISNSGDILADGQTDGGQIAVTAEQIDQSGLLSADGQVDGGIIELSAVTAVTQLAGGVLSAQGITGQGGSVTIASLVTDQAPLPGEPTAPLPDPSQTLIAGTIRVSGRRGGYVEITGDNVELLDGAELDADGTDGGGTILIGGGYQGADPEVANAQTAYVASTAVLSADATEYGDGGTVIVWSDDATFVYGQISATGGAYGGDGGFAETSGHYLEVTNAADLSAPNGQGGTWLLDPNDITIQAAGIDTNVSVSGNLDFTTLGDGSIITTATIEAALNLGTNVKISTGTAGSDSQAGDITVADPISKTLGGDASLTLNAHNDIYINADITSTLGRLDMAFDADSDGSGGGSVYLANGGSAVTLDANGGLIDAAAESVFLSSGQTAAIDSAFNAGSMSLSGNSTLSIDTDASILTITNNFNWSDGTVSGRGALITTGATTLNGAAALQDAVWSNSGTITLSGAGSLYLDDTAATGVATLTNQSGGTIDMNSANYIPISGSGSSVFDNAGTLNWNAVDPFNGYSKIYLTEFNNSGTVNVNANLKVWDTTGSDSGTYNIASGETLTFYVSTRSWNAGAAFIGAGSLVVDGAAITLNTPLTFGAAGPDLTLTGGGTLDAGADLTLDSNFTWNGGGTIKGAGLLTTTGTTTIDSSATLQDKTWDNSGTVNLTGSGSLYLNDDTSVSGVATLSNLVGGVINMDSTNSFPIYGYNASTFDNAGTFNWNAVVPDNGFNELLLPTFNNSGTVNVNDNLYFDGVGGADTGTYNIAAGTTLTFYGNTRTWDPGIAFNGTGSLVVDGAYVYINAPLTFASTGPSLTLQNYGTLDASADLTIDGDFNWTYGWVMGSGLLTTTGNTTVGGGFLSGKTWNNSGTVTLDTFLYLWAISPSDTTTFNNLATGVVEMDSTYGNPIYALTSYDSGFGSSYFNNYGTLNWNASASSDISSQLGVYEFNNYGTVNVNDYLYLYTLSGSDAGGYNVAAGKTLGFNQSAGERSWDSGLTFNGAGTVAVLYGNVNVNTPLTFAASGPDLGLSGFLTLNAAADLTVDSNFTWDFGTISGVGTLTTTAITTIEQWAILQDITWNNGGTVDLTGASYLYLDDTAGSGIATLNNLAGGTINMESTISSPIYGYNASSFTNAGTLNWNAIDPTQGFSMIYLPTFNNSGTVNANASLSIGPASGADTGTYYVAAGETLTFWGWGGGGETRTWDPGLTLSGTGTLAITDMNFVINTALSFGTLTTPSLTLTNGNIDADADLTVAGNFTWTGGVVSGSGLLTTTGTTTIDGGANLQDKTWNNSGTIDMVNSGSLYLESLGIATPTLNNLLGGVINMDSTNAAPFLSFGTSIIDNAGTLNWNAEDPSSGYSQLQVSTFNNSGTVNANASLSIGPASGADTGSYTVAAGETLTFWGWGGGGETRIWDPGLTLGGTGTLAIADMNFVINTALTFENLTLTNGNMDADADLSVAGNFIWTSGVVSGAGLLTTTGTTTLDGTPVLQDKTWDNSGAVDLIGWGYLVLDDTGASGVATLNNLAGGVFNMGSTDTYPISGTGASVFDNAGTLNWNASYPPAGSSGLTIATFNNSGAVNVNDSLQIAANGTDTGLYNIAAGKSLTFYDSTQTRSWDSGIAFTGTGSLVIDGATITLTTPLALQATGPSLTLKGSGAFDAASDLMIAGDFSWSDGTISGSGLLSTTGTTTIDGYAILQDKTWDNSGTIDLMSTNYVALELKDDTSVAGVPTFNNLAGGVFNMGSDDAYAFVSNYVGSGTGSSVFNNYGTINWNAMDTSGLSFLIASDFNNSGTFNANANVRIEAAGTDTGDYYVAAGNTLTFYTARTFQGLIDLAAGATFSSNGGNFLNQGTLSGSGTVDLSWGPNFGNWETLTNDGIIAPGGSAGTLTVIGNYTQTAAGELDLELNAGNYDALAVSGAATLDGTLNLSGSGADGGYTVITANSVGGSFAAINQGTLGAVPTYNPAEVILSIGGIFWDGGAGTFLWTDALNWTTDLLPTGTDTVTIGALTSAVILDSGSQSVLGLSSDADFLLSGGSLTVGTGGATFNGDFSMSGGTLDASGDVTANNTFNWSGGTITGAGILSTPSGTASTLSGTGTKTLLDKTWNNAGNIVLSGGVLLLDDTGTAGNAVLNNQAGGVIDVDTATANPLQGAGSALIDNAGTFNWNGLNPAMGYATNFVNTGTVNVNQNLQVVYNGVNSGTYNIAAGTSLEFASGTQNLNAGTAFTGSGDLNLTGADVNVNAALTFGAAGPDLTMSGGILTTDAALTVNSAFAWSGGVIGGAGDYTFAGGFDYSGGAMAAAGNVAIVDASGTLELPAMPSITSLAAKSSGDLILNGDIAASGGGEAIVLVAGGSFINLAGATALSAPNGNWLVYSVDPALDNRGGLSYDFKQYNMSYSGGAYTGPGSGNGFIYSIAPAVTVELTGAIGKTYDGTTDAALTAANYTVTGGTIDGDSVTITTPSSGTYSDKNAGSGKLVTAAGVTVASADNGGIPVYGYTVAGSSAGGLIGTIDPATLAAELSGTVEKPYDGTTAATLDAGDYTFSGLIIGDTVVLTNTGDGSLTGVYASADIGSGIPVTVSDLSLTGQDAGNYQLTVTTLESPVGVIDYGQASWNGAGGDALWSNPLNWNSGAVPNGNYDITLDWGGATVLFDGGSFSAHDITSSDPLLVSGGTLSVAGDAAFNAGLTQTGGILDGAGTITVNGNYDWSGGTLANGGGTTVNGNLNLSGAATPSTLDTSLTVTGTVDQSGWLDLTSNARLNSGSFTNDGLLTGFGTIDLGGGVLTNNGTIAPGSSPGTLTIAGDLLLTSSSILNLEANSPAAGSYDQLNVTGTTTLDGTLNVSGTALDGSYPLMTAGSLLGTFAAVNTNGLPISLQYASTQLNAVSSWPAASVETQPAEITDSFTFIDISQIVVTASNISTSSANTGGTTSSSDSGGLFAEIADTSPGAKKQQKRQMPQCRIEKWR